MRLEAILEFAGLTRQAEGWEPYRALEVTGVACDSRRTRPGDLFVALPGASSDGHAFLEQAAAAGAVAAVVEHPVDAALPQIRVDHARAVMGRVAAAAYAYPGERLYTVGVTGTNGKTTVTHLIRGLLSSTGTGVGLIGTVRYIVGGEATDAVHTTPEAPDIQRLLAGMRDAGDKVAVLEVSSHALALDRIEGVSFDVACFTNLGRDHLDFHADMDEYLAVKTTLFTKYRKRGGTAVVSIDQAEGVRIAREVEPPVLTVGLKPEAEVRAEEIEIGPGGVAFTLHTPDGIAPVRSPLPGLFNIENMLIAAAVGHLAGFETERIAGVLSQIEGVEGRMERLPGPEGVILLLDYAHKPEALRGALQACRELGEGALLVVFGCGGDRDRGKRPLMGRIAALGADRVYVTSDNPRSEDPRAIIDEIMAGVPPEADVVVEPDRRRAIALAVQAAQPGDVVLVAGKGHERYQIVGGDHLPFDERDVVAEAVASVGRTA